MRSPFGSLSVSYRILTSPASSLFRLRSISTTQVRLDVNNYLLPLNYNLTEIVNEVRDGKGFFVLKRAFSKSDVAKANSAVEYYTEHNRVDTNTDNNQYAKHNSYGDGVGGIIWNLLGKDKIFEKIAQHPATLEVTRTLLGPKSQISSNMSNTVLPGMDGQVPHLDYPYYKGYFPTHEADIQRPLLSVSFMIMLTKFDKRNGGTAVIPGSQRRPTYPHDKEEFYRNMVQMEGEPGDVGIFSAALQHCAMKNYDTSPRVGIVQSMVPAYVTPYHQMELPHEYLSDISSEMQTILAINHPYPMKH